jgi:hypothetical protein
MAGDWREERPELAQQVAWFEEALQKVSDQLEAGVAAFDAGDFDPTNVIGLTGEYTPRLERHAAAITRLLREET